MQACALQQCQKPFDDHEHTPLQTHCGQTICWKCALENFKQNSQVKCPVCNELIQINPNKFPQDHVVDLLQELDQLDKIVQCIDENNCSRICQYIVSSSLYSADTDEFNKTINIAYQCYMKVAKYPEALRMALRLSDINMVNEIIKSCQDQTMLKQLCFMVAKQKINIDLNNPELNKILSNEYRSSHFQILARDLEVEEPKNPDQIIMSYLEERSQQLDSAKHNLGLTYINAFVNAGFGRDNLMTQDRGDWINKNKDSGQLSAAASLGLILLWDIDAGLTQIDKFQYSQYEWVKAGALLAFGINASGIRNEADPTFALVGENIDSPNKNIKHAAILALAIAYAGSAREDLLEKLTPLVLDTSLSIETSALAALALGHIFVATRNEDVAQSICQTLMDRENDLNHAFARFFAVGIGLIFLGHQDKVNAVLSVLEIIQHPISKFCKIVANTFAYAGSGNVLKIQELFHICAEHYEMKVEEEEEQQPEPGQPLNAQQQQQAQAQKEKKEKKEREFLQQTEHQSAAVLGIPLIALGEDIGMEMNLQSFDYLLQYCEMHIRRIIPLSLALCCISNPKIEVTDRLQKLSHDIDQATAMNAILGLGLVGAGTNNARLATTLRQLADYYNREPHPLFIVRIAQGLLHLGKGLMTLQPYHSDKFLLNNTGLAGILTVIFSMLNAQQTILADMHYLLYFLVSAIQPRMMLTLNEELKPQGVLVRVGKAVDIVGQSGWPRAITGFQTHTTPVLLAHNERAEFATEEFLPYNPLLEDVIIVRKNPDYQEEANKQK